MFELEETRTWERSPHMYGEVLASSLATQAIFTYAPEEERARRVLSKLRQVPRLIQAARDNVKDPPAIYVKVGLDTWRGREVVHRRRPAARVLDRRRPPPAGRPGRRVRRGGAGGRRLRRLSRDRSPSAREGHLPARRRDVSSRSFASKKAFSCPWIACSPSRCASCRRTQEEFRRVAGRLERRRPARGLAQDQGRAPGAGDA